MNKLARIAITPGEPAGIGPDLVIQLAQQSFPEQLIVVADREMIQQRAELLKLPLRIIAYEADRPAKPSQESTLSILHVPMTVPTVPGQLDVANADYVIKTLTIAAQKCLAHEFAALVTGPIHKGIINDAGVPFQGHTEFLAEFSGVNEVVMMLATDNLRVALVTTHIPLANVPRMISRERLRTSITILIKELSRYFGVSKPRIAVCGLNPHAGENGHLGREEIDIITPVIQEFVTQGENVTGPFAADTVFTKKHLVNADAVLAMYHDQGLPVLKAQGFGQATNITLGLPFIRTSVDHGTALELAGSGNASASSLRHALSTAMSMLNHSPA